MREIEFRGISVDSKMWAYGDLYRGCLNTTIAYPINISPCQSEPAGGVDIIHEAVNHKTVGQFTGLTDKNGVKIFEGDIYNHGDENIKYKVIFKDGQFIGNQIGNKSLAGLSYWREDIEIVGNIHEVKP